MPYEIYDSNTQDNAIAQYWKNTLSKFFVNYTKNCLIKKAKKGYKIWIVSASPLIYIAPIVNYLPIDKIVAIEPSKIISYGPGKVKRIAQRGAFSLHSRGIAKKPPPRPL